MAAPLVGAALVAAKIIARKRAADIAKKKIVRVSTKDAREVAREMSQRVGGSKPLGRSKGTGNIPTRPTNVPKKNTVRNIQKKTAAQSSAEKRTKVFTEKEGLRRSLRNPPAKKSSKQSSVMMTKKIPTRQEMLGAKKVVKYRGKDLILSPGQINKLRSATKKETTGIYERQFGISPKTRDILDKKVIERANQIEKEGRAEYLRQMRDSKINPNLTRDPSKKLMDPTSEQAVARAKRMLAEEIKRRGKGN
jgi:hypothetical protein